MSVIQWPDEFSVGDPEIDRQHRELVVIINDLHAALLARGDGNSLQILLARLMSHLRGHFEHEEALMLACDYPAYDQHKRAHEDLLEKVRKIQERLTDSEHRPYNVTVMQFILKWLVLHMRENDAAFVPYLRAETRSVA